MKSNVLMSKLIPSRFASIAILVTLLSLAGRAHAVTDEAEFNRRATATAQILAGITPSPI